MPSGLGHLDPDVAPARDDDVADGLGVEPPRDSLGVFEVADREHAGRVLARHAEPAGPRARREDDPVEPLLAPSAVVERVDC